MEKLDCGHAPEPDLLAPGFAKRRDGSTMCITCLAEKQVRDMEVTGEGKLTYNPATNRVETVAGLRGWPVFERRESDHNIAMTRTDFWFVGPDLMRWHGSIFGEQADTPIAVKRATGLHQLREQLKAIGATIYLQGGEYCVKLRHGPRDQSYYTTDPVDAFRTAMKMAEQRDNARPIDPSVWGA